MYDDFVFLPIINSNITHRENQTENTKKVCENS